MVRVVGGPRWRAVCYRMSKVGYSWVGWYMGGGVAGKEHIELRIGD